MAVAVLPLHNLGLRGLSKLGLGDTSGTPGPGVQIVQGAAGPYIADANGNTVYTQAEVVANPALLQQVTASSGCPAGSQPTWTMAGSVCQWPGNPDCLDPTGVCGSYLQPGQSLANPGNANQGWVLQADGTWGWNGPGQPTTPSPGAINELTTTYVPTFATQVQQSQMQSNPSESTTNTNAGSNGITTGALLAAATNPGTCAAFGGAWIGAPGMPNGGTCTPVTTNQSNTNGPASNPICPQVQKPSCGSGMMSQGVDGNGCAVFSCIPLTSNTNQDAVVAGGTGVQQSTVANASYIDPITSFFGSLTPTEIMFGVVGIVAIGAMFMMSGSRH